MQREVEKASLCKPVGDCSDAAHANETELQCDWKHAACVFD